MFDDDDSNNNETPTTSMPKEFFLRGLGLGCCTMSGNNNTPTTTEATTPSTSSASSSPSIVRDEQRRRRKTLLRLLAKRSDIPITSAAGQALLARSPLSVASLSYQRERHERAERYCTKTSAVGRRSRSRRLPAKGERRGRRRRVFDDVDADADVDDEVQRLNGTLLAGCAPLTVVVQRLTARGIDALRSMWKTFGWRGSLQMRVVLRRIDG